MAIPSDFKYPSLSLDGNYNFGMVPTPAYNVSTINNQSAYNSLGLNQDGTFGNFNFGSQLNMPQSTGMLGQMSNWMSNNQDLLKAGIGVVTGGIGAWQGYQSNKLARDQMNQQASQFREQMDISKQLTNSQLEDRQRARVASNPQAYESVQDYMKKYGVK